MKKVYIDLETTGLDPAKHGIWQLAAEIEIDGVIVDEIVILMQPHKGKLISAEALAKTGMTIEKLMTFMEPLKAFKLLDKWLAKHINRFKKTDKAFWFGYNANFDYQFARQWWLDCGDEYFGSWFFFPYVDVLQKAAIVLIPERLKMEKFKLGFVCRYLGIHFDDDEAHDALYDNRKTRELDKFLDTFLVNLRLGA